MWSQERFGDRAARRYRDLLKQALSDILFLSRDRARGGLGVVGKPRHFLVYRRRGEAGIDVVRALGLAHSNTAGHELASPCSPVRTPYSHALAIFQSRLTVSGEIPRTSAVSSTLNPPK